jgi:hypothetical protein
METTEPRFQKLEDGRATTADDPQRGVWYANCGYWTDDWTTLGNTSEDKQGIPLCPTCGCPGFQSTAQSWYDGAKSFAGEEGNERYVEFLDAHKGKCLAAQGKTFLEVFEQWKTESQETQ